MNVSTFLYSRVEDVEPEIITVLRSEFKKLGFELKHGNTATVILQNDSAIRAYFDVTRRTADQFRYQLHDLLNRLCGRNFVSRELQEGSFVGTMTFGYAVWDREYAVYVRGANTKSKTYEITIKCTDPDPSNCSVS